jgi:tetratricopeptide (TPR) repeat protein
MGSGTNVVELVLNVPAYEAKCYAHFNLGRVHEHSGCYEEALACYGAVLDANPEYTEAEWARLALLARMN